MVFTQQKAFTLRSYRLVQRGPTFPADLEVTVERERGRYRVRSRREGGEAKVVSGEVEVGEESVLAGDRRLQTTHYVMTPKLGLLRGAAAALLGKTPADYPCWVVTSGAPAFVAIDGPLYTGGPIWRIETVSPRGPTRPAKR